MNLPRYDQVQYQVGDFPRQVRLESSSFCNSSCKFCHLHGDFNQNMPLHNFPESSPPSRKKGKMSWSMYSDLVEEISMWGEPLQELVPTNFGELFINKDWEDMLHLAADFLPNTRLCLVTTGSLLTPEVIEKLARVRTLGYVNFSLNAYFAETWERVVGTDAKYMETAIKAVHTLRDRRPDIMVNVSMVFDTDLVTPKERDLFEEYWAQFGSVTINQVSYAGHPLHVPYPPQTLPCRSVFDGLTVFDQGSVSHNCCFNGQDLEDLRVGHWPEESLLEIWRGDKMKRFADLHNSGQRAKIYICRRCTFA